MYSRKSSEIIQFLFVLYKEIDVATCIKYRGLGWVQISAGYIDQEHQEEYQKGEYMVVGRQEGQRCQKHFMDPG